MKKFSGGEVLLKIIRLGFLIFRILWLYSISVDSIVFKFISNLVLSDSAFAYFYVIKAKTYKTHLEKQHSLHMQATPDNGL